MKNPPCIRGLKPFEKGGCPQKAWNGNEGCLCWIELTVSKRGSPLQKEIKKQCIDLWAFDFQWAMMGLLEGNQKAVESFRNGMVEEGDDGKAKPKSDDASLALFGLFRELKKEQARLT